MTSLTNEQKIQENQYRVPYHYIPSNTPQGFSQHLYWSWGFRYLGGLRVAADLCNHAEFESLLDVGCGDGRFLQELSTHHSDKHLEGIDYSTRAIGLAKALNPGIDFRTGDITTEDIGHDAFDLITLIEVIEHIPELDLSEFLRACSSKLRKGGKIVLTAPHSNEPVSDKHFQHFDSELIASILPEDVSVKKMVFFDRNNKLISLMQRAIGGSGSYFLITNQKVLNFFFQFYLKYGLYSSSEKDCRRVACVAEKVT